MNPDNEYTLRWEREGAIVELVVTHVKTGVSIGVGEDNVKCCRPSRIECLRAASASVANGPPRR